MRVDARRADEKDVQVLAGLYRSLEAEMIELHPMWPVADGLDEPAEESLRDAVADPEVITLIGTVDDYPFGFLLARSEPLLTQANGERVGAIRLIFVDHEAREVAVGEAMREMAMDMLREKGITKFDAHVLPGHRLAKNFFEAGGFSARSIVMHHDDDKE
jgi:ribosomal protein S18 acetylase RimI-like enzyme